MKKELIVRFWDLLPEAELIPELLRDAPQRVRAMIEANLAQKVPSDVDVTSSWR